MFGRLLRNQQLVKNSFRSYNLHEYQSIELLNKYSIPTPLSFVAHSADEAFQQAIKIDKPEVVVKAQILAGGRGKGFFLPNKFQGGVHIAPVQSVHDIAAKMIGQYLVTRQTGVEGKPCDKVMISEKVNLVRELYLAILLDRKFGGPVLVISSKGGMDIEEVAAKEPHEITSIPINIHTGITADIVAKASQAFNLTGTLIAQFSDILSGLYKLFSQKDLIQLEINPLGITKDERMLICDAKLNFDENASYRQQDTYKERDIRQENNNEIEAQKFGLSYISMDGNIGCLVNGAGLAMATMDLIKLTGGEPANFLDVGGGASEEQIVNALKILETNQSVDAIMVNIFGGIMRCDIIAHGIISAAKKVNLSKPVVARLCGTNWKEASEIIKRSEVSVICENDEEEAVKKIVKIAQIKSLAKEIDVKVTFAPSKNIGV